MGPLKILGLLVSGLLFLYGLALSDDVSLIALGMIAFMLCLFAPSDI